MQTLMQDIRYALRQLRAAPGFTLTAVLTLALGIGATTAIFTLVYQVVLRQLPVQQPQQLYKVGKDLNCCISGGLQDDWALFSYDLYKTFRDQTPDTAGIVAVQSGRTGVSVRVPGSNGAALPLAVRFISGNYFPVLGVQTFAGRLINTADDNLGAPPVAVISYALWQAKFAANRSLVGSSLMLSGHPVTIVGISAPSFQGDHNQADDVGLWMPLSQEAIFDSDRPLTQFPDQHWLNILIRIPNKKNVPQVQFAVQSELHHWISAHPEAIQNASPATIARQTTELASAETGINDYRDEYEHSLNLLLLIAGFVLLIACANLANLMLVRGVARRQELALRTALGAPRGRLVRQMLVEAIVLSSCGGIAAIAVAYLAARAFISLAFAGAIMVPITPIDTTPSPIVLGFALLVSLLTGIVFGIAPALLSSNTAPIEALRGNARSSKDSSAFPQKALVIFQAALSLVLLSTAGLLISSLRQLEHQNFHFDTQGRLVLFVDLGAAGLNYDQLGPFYQRIDDIFARVPAIQSFGYATYTPMSYNNWNNGIFFPGQASTSDRPPVASYTLISPHYFEAVGTRLLAGRAITEQDTSTSPLVAVVNKAFVTQLLHGKQPIGLHFGEYPDHTSTFEIVGVVDDTRYGDPDKPTVPMYFPSIRQSPGYPEPKNNASEHSGHFANNVVVQYRGDEASAAAAVRQALQTVDPNLPILSMTSYEEELSSNFTQQDLVVRLTTLFGLLALLLASIGIYGVTAYSVARRTSEIGIRMALGASRRSVLSMILKRAFAQALIGLVIGIPLAYGAARLLASSLYQTTAFQPGVLAAVSALLLIATFAAAAIPSARAASVNPTEALRTE